MRMDAISLPLRPSFYIMAGEVNRAGTAASGSCFCAESKRPAGGSGSGDVQDRIKAAGDYGKNHQKQDDLDDFFPLNVHHVCSILAASSSACIVCCAACSQVKRFACA